MDRTLFTKEHQASLPAMRTLVIVLATVLLTGSSQAAPAVDMEEVWAKLEKLPRGTELEIKKGVSITLHRMQAKSPIRGGWHRAVSTHGNYSVEVPATFNDYAMRASAQDGVGVQVDGIGTTTEGDIAWGVTCIRRVDGSVTPESKAITDKTESVGQPIRGWTRVRPLGDRICTMSVEAKGTASLPPSASIKRFLNSLKSTK